MRRVVFYHEVSSWYCSTLLNCILRGYNCQLWRMGMNMYVFKAFCTRKERKLRDGQTIHFRFYLSELKSYLSHTYTVCVGSEQTNSHVLFKNAWVPIRRH